WKEAAHSEEDAVELLVTVTNLACIIFLLKISLEAAADRVFLASRLFVRLFNQRGASLQQRILDLLAMADAADHFHKKTVTASVGGGVASVAGSITTITGLILAPFTLGTSLIVTAVGIGVATAGCRLESRSAEVPPSKAPSPHTGPRAPVMAAHCSPCVVSLCAVLCITMTITSLSLHTSVTRTALKILISTVKTLSAAGGAAKAARAISVTSGVMSALFLALDVFFLAKDSLELRKGAKTQFAAKIREVCKELQEGLLELNAIKEQLQKIMDAGVVLV
uniref:Uncharacterized protein n=1 Tax=Denticeps clupeoides TaxID=299321 RepID=A0AAY4BRQ4_9TELE